jgi:hypothetical protein
MVAFFRKPVLLSLRQYLHNTIRMKITLKALGSFLAVVALLAYSGCGKDPAPAKSVEEQQLEKLVSTWNVSDVKLDGGSKTTDYTGFKLTISGTAGATEFNYTTATRPTNSPWPSNGTWKFGTDPETQIVRDPASTTDKLDLTYALSADGSQLKITFVFAGAGYPARVSNVKGQWEFNFTK